MGAQENELIESSPKAIIWIAFLTMEIYNLADVSSETRGQS